MFSNDEIFTKDSKFSPYYLRKAILKHNLREYKCEICGRNPEWNNKPLVLVIDHIDGNSTNNELANLRFLCPNCHSQTETFCGRNKNSGRVKVTDEELVQSLKQSASIRDALISVGLAPKGGNYKRCYRLISKHCLNIS